MYMPIPMNFGQILHLPIQEIRISGAEFVRRQKYGFTFRKAKNARIFAFAKVKIV